jgi:post-segregation antitoxin (ccd killing protein)
MHQTERMCITLPKGLRNRAHAAGINVSGVAANAVSRIVEISEKETPASSRQTIAGATATCEGRAS